MIGFGQCISGDCENGYGTYEYMGKGEGNKYIGEHKDRVEHGLGTYTWGKGPNEGDKYVGEYKDGKRHGVGTYTWASGDKYVGEWKDGDKHGRAFWIVSDGSYDVVFFEEGKPISWKCFDKYGNEKDCE